MRPRLRQYLRAVVSPLFFYSRLLIFAIAFLSWLATSAGAAQDPRVCIRNQCFDVELAVTPLQRETGLMNRSKLGANRGMWFVFERSDIYGFWMKDTRIPLDIIWVNESGRIVDIVHSAAPGRLIPMIPAKPARYVLEINGGMSKVHRFKIGDRVTMPN